MNRSTVPVRPSSVGSMYDGQFSKNSEPPPPPVVPPVVLPVVPGVVPAELESLSLPQAASKRGQREAGCTECAGTSEELAAGEIRTAGAERRTERVWS